MRVAFIIFRDSLNIRVNSLCYIIHMRWQLIRQVYHLKTPKKRHGCSLTCSQPDLKMWAHRHWRKQQWFPIFMQHNRSVIRIKNGKNQKCQIYFGLRL
mgnify:CR=1 FL=1